MAGRKPKPTALKELAGNPGKRPLNKREPKPGTADPRVPRGRLPLEGQRLWRALVGPLSRMGVLTEVDLPALEMLCLHYAVARDAYQLYEDEGMTAETADGGIKTHPAMSVFRQNSIQFRMYLGEFGLTPASRVRIKVEPEDKEKTLAELLFEGVGGE